MNNLKERILDNVIPVTETGCWLWTGHMMSTGYGRTQIKDKTYLTHRLSYEAFNEPIPEGLWVLHKCDVRLCVNPKHLFVGTHQDNMNDAVKKGRTKKILRADDVELIKQLKRKGFATQNVACLFGVSSLTIYRAIKEGNKNG